MDPTFPEPNYQRDFQWFWPCGKFPLDPTDLFTTLHDRFNTKPLPLQDPQAFHRDVFECADKSDTIDEFYSRLEKRKAQRIKEMSTAWQEISTLLFYSPLLSCQVCYDPETDEVKMKPGTKNHSAAQRRHAFVKYAKWRSFDALIEFFDGYVRDEREEKEKWRRQINERIDGTRRERAAKRATTASGSNEATTSGSPRRTSPRTSRNKLKSRRNASVSTKESPAASAAGSERSPPTSSSRRSGPPQADGPSPKQMAESSRAAKRRNDEDASGSARKKRRMASEDHVVDDVEAEQDKSGAQEAAPFSTRRGKRKSIDDSLSEARRKKAKLTDSPRKMPRQFSRRSADQDQPDRASSPSDGSLSSYHDSEIPETQMPEQDYSRENFRRHMIGQFIDPSRALFMQGTSQSPSEGNSEAIDASQEIPQADEDELAHGLTEISKTAAVAAAEEDTKKPKRKLQKKPRASNRQRVDKRRSTKEQDPSPPKKQPRRKKPQERNPSPSAQRVLRSTRSSRRDSGQELWFLGDDFVARAVGNTKRA